MTAGCSPILNKIFILFNRLCLSLASSLMVFRFPKDYITGAASSPAEIPPAARGGGPPHGASSPGLGSSPSRGACPKSAPGAGSSPEPVRPGVPPYPGRGFPASPRSWPPGILGGRPGGLQEAWRRPGGIFEIRAEAPAGGASISRKTGMVFHARFCYNYRVIG